MNKFVSSKHCKSVSGICLAMALILSGAFGEITAMAASPHYYAKELQGFKNSAAGKITAVLYDLDGCGNDEMIAFAEGIPSGDHWASLSEGAKIAVFDAKDNKSKTIEPEISRTAYKVYISNRNNLVVYDLFEVYSYNIYKYQNGVLREEAVLVDGSYAFTTYYSINGIECDESQFNRKLKEFDLDNAAVAIGTGSNVVNSGWKQVRDDTSGPGKIYLCRLRLVRRN